MNAIKNTSVGVIGANGKTGRLLVDKLLNQGFNDVTVFIRNDPSQREMFDKLDVKIKFLDLLKDDVDALEEYFNNIDIIVFTAGSGTQGVKQLFTVDLDGVAKCIEACEKSKVKRFLLTSVINVENRDFWWNILGLRSYFIAKRCADHEVRNSKLNYTILQPGWLRIGKGTGKLIPQARLEERRDEGYTIEREDLAEVIVECILHPETTSMKSIPLANGDTPIHEVISNL